MLKKHFSRFLDADPERLHFAAHRHHFWPDVSFDAHVRAWTDAATLADDKWDGIFGKVWPRRSGTSRASCTFPTRRRWRSRRTRTSS